MNNGETELNRSSTFQLEATLPEPALESDADVDSRRDKVLGMVRPRGGHEPDLLLHDFLTDGRRFFRDPDAFEVLRRSVLPDVLARKPPGAPLRAWVVGCGTGEEAYGLAISIIDNAELSGLEPRLQLFATDTDAEALRTARNGTYSRSIEADVPSDILARYFERANGYYRIGKRIRDCVVFAPHDLTKQAPFSGMDVISCRNLFLHGSPDLVARLLPFFHYALVPGGHLLPGSIERAGILSGLFAPVDKRHRVLRKNEMRPPESALRAEVVFFERRAGSRARPAAPEEAVRGASVQKEEVLQKFDQTERRLRELVEELVHANEELRARNGELVAANEELRARNEDLAKARLSVDSANVELELMNRELRQRLAELAAASSDVENLLASTRIATLFLDGELRVKSFTPAATDLLGVIEGDRGQPAGRAVRRLRYDELEQDAASVHRTLTPKEVQLRSSEDHWYLVRLLPYRSIENVIDGVVITFSDITELKHAELQVQKLGAALESQLRWLKALMDVVPVGIAYYEKGQQGVAINRAAADMLQIPGSHVGKTTSDPLAYLVWANDDASPEERPLLEAATRASPVEHLEIELPGAGGARHLVLRSAALVDTSAATYGQVSAFWDITEIKRAREQAIAREQQQAIIAELGLRALEQMDLQSFLREGLRTLCNVADIELCDVLRLTEEKDALEVVCRVGFSSAAADRGEPVVPNSLAEAGLRRAEAVVFERASCPYTWPDSLLAEGVQSGVRLAISGEGRQPFGLLGVYSRKPREFSKQDLIFLRAIAIVLTSAIQRQIIEEARLRERETAALRRSEEQLRRAERLAWLGTFAAGIAHELNNPLNNIALAADYAEKSPDAERRGKMISSIKANAERCGRIIESVLRFARNETTQKWATDANSIIRRSVDLLRAEFGSEKLELRLKLEEGLPPIRSNPTELEQVFVNLVRNAVEAHPGKCTVEIHSRLAYPCIRLVVSDDGPGISAAHLPRIFDPFFSKRRRGGGTGLGLSITHRIVTAHGGIIRASSEEGKGAKFSIELPLAPEGAKEEELNDDEGLDRGG
ncbi:MAG TPA: CheR family methyltransferase [Polyangiaceae bacterium]|nr:CheR family methyltransferase [Polyangiaceae bacterium]